MSSDSPKVASTRARRAAWAGAFVLAAIAGAALFLVAEVVLFTWLGFVHRHALPLEERLSSATVTLSAKWHAGNRRNPLQDTAGTLAIGETGYRPCVECHGAQGDGQAELGQSVFPQAASLLRPAAKELTDAELFWIIKHGLSFTAMPAYETQYRDEAIWAIVSYVRALQQGRALAFGPPPAGEPDAERAQTQAGRRFPLAITDSGIQPVSLSVRPGIVELDIVNQGARGHQVVVSAGGKVPFNAGRLLPTQTVQLQGKLDAGSYTVAIDPGGNSPGPTVTLTVR